MYRREAAIALLVEAIRVDNFTHIREAVAACERLNIPVRLSPRLARRMHVYEANQILKERENA